MRKYYNMIVRKGLTNMTSRWKVSVYHSCQYMDSDYKTRTDRTELYSKEFSIVEEAQEFEAAMRKEGFSTFLTLEVI